MPTQISSTGFAEIESFVAETERNMNPHSKRPSKFVSSFKDDNLQKKKTHRKSTVQWSSQEDALLFEKYQIFGSRWVQLAPFFPGKQILILLRSDNSIKNRFYCCMRKLQRRMNETMALMKLKHKKPIRYDSLITILEIGKYDSQQKDKRFENVKQNLELLMELKGMIVEIGKLDEDDISCNLMGEMVQKFMKAKFCLKFINKYRVKKYSKSDQFFQSSNPCPSLQKSQYFTDEQEQKNLDFNDSILEQISFEIGRSERIEPFSKEDSLFLQLCGENPTYGEQLIQ